MGETRIEFEVATLADVVAKAAIIAPAKAGNAFDKAAGIVVEVTPNADVKCVVRATNLDVFYLEVVDCMSAEGDDVRWRLPSSLLDSILKNIKPTPGKTITFSTSPDIRRVSAQSGRLRATIGLIDSELFPTFDVVDPDQFSAIAGVGARIESVAWAAAKPGSEPLSGIHFTGTHVVATDRYRVARMPLSMPLAAPITVPVGVLATLLKRAGEIQVGATANQIVFRPDDYTQITCSLYGDEYLKISPLLDRVYEHSVMVNKQDVLELISRTIPAAAGDRFPILRFIIGKSELAMMLAGNDASIGDVVELPGQCDHPRISLYFTPAYLTDAISKSPVDVVRLSYWLEEETRIPLRVDGGEYSAWIAPRRTGNAG